MANHAPGISNDPHSPIALWVGGKGFKKKCLTDIMATLQKHGELDGSAGDARVEKIIHNIYSRLVGRSVVDLVFD